MAKTEEIIQKSGVSRSTVFRFFRGENVRPEARRAILNAMEDLGFKKEAIYKHQDMVFEVSVTKDFERFKGFTEVIQGITERAEEKGIKIQLAIRNLEQMKKDDEKWNDNNAATGIIIIGKDADQETKEGEYLKERKIPHIFVNRIINEPQTSYVAVDVREAACEMTEVLLQKGHRKIAVFGYPNWLRIDRDKLDGFMDAYHKRGLSLPKEYMIPLNKGDSSDEAIEQILHMEERPSAFFGICDSYAMKMIHRAQDIGYNVPADLAVVGMDDLDIAQFFKPALTTIKTPFKKMGILAVENLFQLVTEDLMSIKTIVKHHLYIREST